jgi:hypothetical protein
MLRISSGKTGETMKKFTVELKQEAIVNTEQSKERITKFIFEGEDIEVRDEYHSMHELYEHRMALNIALFNVLNQIYPKFGNIKVVKSRLHADGTMFDGYFIVMAYMHSVDNRAINQISYHYKLKHWDKFKIPEVEMTPVWDGHSSLEAMERLMKL